MALGAFGAIALAAPEPAGEMAQLKSALRLYGASEAGTERLAAALEKSDGAIRALEPFFSDDEQSIAAAAAILAVSEDESAALEAIRKHLESSDVNRSALLGGLCVATGAPAVEFLVQTLREKPSLTDSTAARLALRVITGESFASDEEWIAWSEKLPPDYAPNAASSLRQLQQRAEAAATALKIGTISDLLAKLKSSKLDGSGPLAEVGKMMQDFGDAMAAGANARSTPAMRRADRAFARGSLSQAAEDYREIAAADPADTRSQYLQACLLLESGDAKQAAEMFDGVFERDPSITSANFLARVARASEAGREKDLFETAVREFAQLEEKPEISVAGWPDSLIPTLVGQSLQGEGIFSIPQSLVERKLSKAGDDAELDAGLTLLRRNIEQPAALRELAARHPDAEIAHAALLSRLDKTRDRDACLAALRRLGQLDPKNGAIPWLLADVEFPVTKSAPDSTTGLALPPEAVARCREALSQPEFHLMVPRLRAAVLRALEALGCPWRIALVGAIDSADMPLGMTCTRLVSNLKLALKNGQIDSAREILEMLEAVAGKLREDRVSGFSKGMSLAALSSAHRAFAEYYDKQKDAERAAHFRQLAANEKATVHEMAELADWFPLIYLPVPSIHQGAIDRLSSKEPGQSATN